MTLCLELRNFIILNSQKCHTSVHLLADKDNQPHPIGHNSGGTDEPMFSHQSKKIYITESL